MQKQFSLPWGNLLFRVHIHAPDLHLTVSHVGDWAQELSVHHLATRMHGVIINLKVRGDPLFKYKTCPREKPKTAQPHPLQLSFTVFPTRIP